MVRQKHYLDELLSAQQHCHDMQDEDIKELCSRMLAHYQEYFEAKSRIAQRDVFHMANLVGANLPLDSWV